MGLWKEIDILLKNLDETKAFELYHEMFPRDSFEEFKTFVNKFIKDLIKIENKTEKDYN